MSDLLPEQHQKTQDGRPDPEALLTRYGLRDEDLHTIASSTPDEDREEGKRGRLRIYLGSVAGSGKTYTMLQEGHRRKERNTDVVIGYVETHKRPHTIEQIGDLEIIPRAKIGAF